MAEREAKERAEESPPLGQQMRARPCRQLSVGPARCRAGRIISGCLVIGLVACFVGVQFQPPGSSLTSGFPGRNAGTLLQWLWETNIRFTKNFHDLLSYFIIFVKTDKLILQKCMEIQIT